MELRHLRCLIAVAEEGHITRAAERLGMAQPALSRVIKTIEQEIDLRLFRRVSRGVESIAFDAFDQVGRMAFGQRHADQGKGLAELADNVRDQGMERGRARKRHRDTAFLAPR